MNNDGLKLRKETLAAKKKFLESSTLSNEKEFKNLKKKYKNLLVKMKQQYYHKKIYQANGDGKKIWAVINESLNRNKSDSDEDIA